MQLFVSYRRKSWPFTQRLVEKLSKLIDADIFVDYTGIDDTDFEKSILGHLRASAAVLVIVSEYTFAPERINQEQDWVRREIATAIALDKPIVLVCADGLFPPPPETLPEDIRTIGKGQGIAFYPDYFDDGVEKLATFITKATPVKARQAARNYGRIAAIALGVVFLVAVLLEGSLAILSQSQLQSTLNAMGTSQIEQGTAIAIQLTAVGTESSRLKTATVLADTEIAKTPTITATTTVDFPKTVAAANTIIALASATQQSVMGAPTPTPAGGNSSTAAPTTSDTSASTQTPEAILTANVPRLLTIQAANTVVAAASATVTPTVSPPAVVLNTEAKFKGPVQATYSVAQEFGVNGHKGIDLAIAVGTPLVASGNGVVAYTVSCTKCTADAPNFISQGISMADAKAIRDALTDPAWGYGFGNLIVVRYAWTDLPVSMRDAMTSANVSNGYAYVIYAQMSRIDVQAGTTVQKGTALGLSGNTGNSTGPHLHLEVRMSPSADDTSVFARVVTNPRNMFDL